MKLPRQVVEHRKTIPFAVVRHALMQHYRARAAGDNRDPHFHRKQVMASLNLAPACSQSLSKVITEKAKQHSATGWSEKLKIVEDLSEDEVEKCTSTDYLLSKPQLDALLSTLDRGETTVPLACAAVNAKKSTLAGLLAKYRKDPSSIEPIPRKRVASMDYLEESKSWDSPNHHRIREFFFAMPDKSYDHVFVEAGLGISKYHINFVHEAVLLQKKIGLLAPVVLTRDDKNKAVATPKQVALHQAVVLDAPIDDEADVRSYEIQRARILLEAYKKWCSSLPEDAQKALLDEPTPILFQRVNWSSYTGKSVLAKKLWEADMKEALEKSQSGVTNT